MLPAVRTLLWKFPETSIYNVKIAVYPPPSCQGGRKQGKTLLLENIDLTPFYYFV